MLESHVRKLRLSGLWLTAFLIMSACQGPTAPSSSSAPSNARPEAPQRVLRIVTNELSNNFSLLPLGGGGGTGVAEVSAGFLLNATLAIADERANVSPYLAQSLP